MRLAQAVMILYIYNNHMLNNSQYCDAVHSGGTTCVWAPVREKHLGPHKMMTYVGRSGEILRQKIFEFRVSEMAFPAFLEHF